MNKKIIFRGGKIMKKVFLVDDDYYVRKGILELIDWVGCGYEVSGEADNGEDALELIKKEKPDVVVTDIKMPVLDGLDLIRELVDITNLNTHFIIISGYNDFKYAQRAVRYGVHDFLLKPIDKEEFESTLMKLSKEINQKKVYEKGRQKRIAVTALNELIKGKVDRKNVDEYIQRLNLTSVSNLQYILIEINDYLSDHSDVGELIQKEVEFIAQAEQVIVTEHAQACFGTMITDKHLHLLNQEINRFIERLQNELSRKLDKEITIYIGSPVEHPYEIQESYKSAVKALQYKYVFDSNEPIYYDEVHTKQINYIKINQSHYDRLMEYVNEHNTDGIRLIVEQIVQDFQVKMFARDAIKTTINRFVHEVIRNIKDREGNEHELSSLQAMLDWDEKPVTLEQIKEIFTQFVLEGSEYILSLNQTSNKGSVHKVKEYVDKHYQKNLTLKDIAKKYYMNSAYLGQLFKKAYGVYFRDYFRQVRIKEAKKRLRQTDMRVYEIAEDVGFENPDYFVTQFRKEVGKTPMNYRKEYYKTLKEKQTHRKDGEKHETVPH